MTDALEVIDKGACSDPPRGALPFTLRVLKRHPWLTARALVDGNSVTCFNTPERARESFFAARVPDSDLLRHIARLQNESQRMSLDAMLLKLPRPKRVTTPMLVSGAERDGCFTQSEVHATARAYRTEAQIFPDMGHDMMLEPGWESVAERIHTWLGDRGL